MSQEIVSKVWKIAGLVGKVTPGALIWKNNQVIFITEDGVQFQTSLSEITDIKWPFSFAKPNASAAEIEIVKGNPLPSVVFAHQYIDDISSLMDIKEDRQITKKWKELLTVKS